MVLQVSTEVLARELGVQSRNKHVRIPHAGSDVDVSGLADDWTTRLPPASYGLAELCDRHDGCRFCFPFQQACQKPVNLPTPHIRSK